MRKSTGAALVIPAWNEAEAIGAVLDEVPPSLFAEVVVVVTDRDDPTGHVAASRGATVVVQRARGYGAACAAGAEHAIARGAEVIAFIDGDYSDPPAVLPSLLAPVARDEADLVLGCRDLRGWPMALPAHARVGNAVVIRLLNVLLGSAFRDLPSCKAIRAERLNALRMQEMTYGWTVEMLVKSARHGLRIEQIDIPYRLRLGGRSKVAGNPRASVLAAWKLLSCAIGYAS